MCLVIGCQNLVKRWEISKAIRPLGFIWYDCVDCNMNYEFVLSVTARTLSTAQYYSKPLCTTKKELLRAAKSTGLFLTVLFKCTTLCCKVLFQSCYTIESRRLRVCWSDAQSDTPSDARTCRMWPQAHEHHKQTQVLRTAARTATTCDSKFWMMLKSSKVST